MSFNALIVFVLAVCIVLEISGLDDLSRESERTEEKLPVQTLRIGYRMVPKSVMANKGE